MEIFCVHCGTTLKEHARFCDNCGTLVPSLPFSLQSSKFPQSPHVTTVSGQNDITSVIKREEVVQSIPSRPTRDFTHDEPSSWMSQLNRKPRLRSKDPSKSLVVAAKPADEEKQPQITELPTEALPVASPPQSEKRSERPISEPSQPSGGSSGLRRNRKLLVITLLSAVVVVLVGSLGAWIILLQPFSVPNITQPQQSFNDSKLGISLLYPRSWTSQVDHSKATVYFYDSSHTGQANIIVGAGSSALTSSVQQQAGQLGVTAQKSEPSLTFAGTTWQRLQGNVQQEGASYTATLLVAVHNQHLYTIIFLAPQAIYTQEEQYVFASMRSSFQFLL